MILTSHLFNLERQVWLDGQILLFARQLATSYAFPSDYLVEWALFMAGADLARQQKEADWTVGLEAAYNDYVMMEASRCVVGQDVVTAWMARDEAPIAGARGVSAGEARKIIEERCREFLVLD